MSAYFSKRLVLMVAFAALVMATSVLAGGGDAAVAAYAKVGGEWLSAEPALDQQTTYFSKGSQPSGSIAIHGPSGHIASTTSANWQDIPHMRGRVTIGKESDLAVAFCAETAVFNGKRLFVRALINNQLAEPSDVLFALDDIIDTNCFTFVKENAPPNIYALRLQWLVDSGGMATMGYRTLTITFAMDSASEMALLATAAPSGADLPQTGGWKDIPNMQGEIDMPAAGDLAITLNAEAYTTNDKRMLVRALVDNVLVPPGNRIITQSKRQGVRTVTFAKRGVTGGRHDVRLQRYVDEGGTGYVGDRTLTVLGMVSGNAQHQTGRLFLEGISGPYVSTPSSNTWHDVPGLSGLIFVPVEGDLVIHFSGNMAADGATGAFMRATVDGQKAAPGEVQITANTINSAYGYNFVLHNIERGFHTIELQWMAYGPGKAHVSDRIMTAYHTAKQIPVLFVAMESERGEAGYKYGGKFSSSVVTQDLSGVRLFRPYVPERLLGDAPSVADYFREQSGDRHFLVGAGLFGPWLKKYNEKYYREEVPKPYTTMKQEAVEKVDPHFDFSYYDFDGDGVVSRDELQVNVIFYQDTRFGELRHIPDYATDDGVTLSGQWITTVYTPDFKNPADIGIFAHELAHATIGALDTYETFADPSAPGPFSLMGETQWHPHLDPMNRLHAADWYGAAVVQKDGYYDIRPVESSRTVYKLLDTNSHFGEYFLVENRQRIGYDAYLPDDGLAIYHVDENVPGAGGGFNDYYKDALEMEPASGLATPIVYGGYLWDGAGLKWGAEFGRLVMAPADSRWKDGSPSGIGVYAISESREKMRAYFDVPGPGILVDVAPETVHTDKMAEFEVRLMNTGQSSDTFDLTASGPQEWVAWSQNTVKLDSYEERIVKLAVTPTVLENSSYSIQIAAQSKSDSSVSTMHWANIVGPKTDEFKANLPLIIR